jgi:hypothetical protein
MSSVARWADRPALPLQDLVDVGCRAAIDRGEVGPVAREAAYLGKFRQKIDAGQSILLAKLTMRSRS